MAPFDNPNCLDCIQRSFCRIALQKKHDKDGNPDVKCHGYEKQNALPGA